MEIRLIEVQVSLAEISAMAEDQFGEMIKAAVDIERGVMAVGGELHSDEEALLLENGSRQEHVWGINLYPQKTGDDLIEFDSMINVRPSQNNRSRGVDDPAIRTRIVQVVHKLTGA